MLTKIRIEIALARHHHHITPTPNGDDKLDERENGKRVAIHFFLPPHQGDRDPTGEPNDNWPQGCDSLDCFLHFNLKLHDLCRMSAWSPPVGICHPTGLRVCLFVRVHSFAPPRFAWLERLPPLVAAPQTCAKLKPPSLARDPRKILFLFRTFPRFGAWLPSQPTK